MENTAKSTFELSVQLVGALAWPLLITALFLYFRRPLTDAMKLVPQKLAVASRFAVGTFSVEVANHALAAGRPELAQGLAGLSAPAIRRLLQFDRTSHYFGLVRENWGKDNTKLGYSLPSREELSVLQELEASGFITVTDPLNAYLSFVDSLPMRREHWPHSDSSLIPLAELSAEHASRMLANHYALSDSGRAAIDAIVEVVARELAKDPQVLKGDLSIPHV